MKKYITLLITGLLIFFLTGCSSTAGPTEYANEEEDYAITSELIGTWENTKKSEEDGEQVEAVTAFTFNEDGTFEESISVTENNETTEETLAGTYLINDYELVLEAEVSETDTDTIEENEFIETAITIELNGDELILTPEGSTAYVFKRVD